MLDEIDLKILSILQTRAKTSNVEIACQVEIAPSMVAFVCVHTEEHPDQVDTGNLLAGIPEVQEVYRVSGEDSYADLRIYEESGVDQRYPDAEKTADKGYQSADHPTLHTPHKKPKGGELTLPQREENRRLAQQRIYVEHSIRRIKGWRILRDEYRLAVGLFATVAQAVVGLVQLGRLLG